MKIIPRSTVSLETQISLADLVDRLSQATSKKETYRRSSGHLPFHGRIAHSEFRIQANTDYADPAKPVIHGKTQDLGEKRRIEIKMHPEGLVLAISFIWAAGIVVFGVFDIIRAIIDSKIYFSILISPAMLTFLYFFLPYRFYRQCVSAKMKVAEIISGSIEPVSRHNSGQRSALTSA